MSSLRSAALKQVLVSRILYSGGEADNPGKP